MGRAAWNKLGDDDDDDDDDDDGDIKLHIATRIRKRKWIKLNDTRMYMHCLEMQIGADSLTHKISRLRHSVDCWGLLLCRVSSHSDHPDTHPRTTYIDTYIDR